MRLCAALHDRVLPLGHPAVRTLVLQSLFQMGSLCRGSKERVYPEHRTGWDAEGGALEALGYELERLAEQLDDTPRDHDAVLLLGEVAAYLGDWAPLCNSVARRFAAMTSRAADGLVSWLGTELQAREHVLAWAGKPLWSVLFLAEQHALIKPA